MYYLSLFLGKLVLFASKLLGSAGSTWPGHVAIEFYPGFLKDFQKRFKGKIVVIAGTNGKTTTSRIVRMMVESDGKKVIHNEAGANLLNGIASAVVNGSTSADVAIFEIDENSLPLLLKELTPDVLVILNLFRDQLDRYGEVNTIALKWKKSLASLPKSTTVILNANDPEIAFLGTSSRGAEGDVAISSRLLRSARNDGVMYFGLANKKYYLAKKPHAMDSLNCPNCSEPLVFDGVYLGHLGDWKCSKCKFKEPNIDYTKEYAVLPGIYNIYNTQAAILVGQSLGIDEKNIDATIKNFKPAFGRQEEFVIDNKLVKIFLSKNPTGFNESLRTIRELEAKHLLLVLNDRIPDGRDVSWIWDVDFEEFIDKSMQVHVSGDRAFDMAVRLKYAHPVIDHVDTHELLDKALPDILKNLPNEETLFILPTYSAMLEVRQILGGRKIL
jgi:UDP-N-acetylmuramyl tripeptide synthase